MQMPALSLTVSPKFKIYIGPIVLVLTLVIVALFVFKFIKPAIEGQNKLSAEKQELSSKKDTMAKTLANLQAINYPEEQQRLSGVDLLIPPKSDLLPMMSFVESLAKSLGLDVLSNRAVGGQVVGPSKELSGYSIQATFAGDYANVMEFLQSLYQSKRAIGLSSVALAGQEGGKVSLTAAFFLPVSSGVVQVDTFNSAVTSLSNKEEEMIQNLKKREIFIAATASASLGRPNPFAAP